MCPRTSDPHPGGGTNHPVGVGEGGNVGMKEIIEAIDERLADPTLSAAMFDELTRRRREIKSMEE